MKLKAEKAATAKVHKEVFKKTVGRSTGLGVKGTWAVAFEKFGRENNAPAKIVSFLKKEYPDRKTDWAKWVHPQRQKYNRGDLGNKPETPIAVYK